MDDNYWKHLYKHAWEKSSDREKAISQLIEQETGRKVVRVGLGAGSTDFLPGSAKSRGHEKGGADLSIEGTNLYLEITRPQTPNVIIEDPLWIRPDKVRNARDHEDYETWVIHILEKDGTLRVIALDEIFFRSYDRQEFGIVHPIIRGTGETYIEIPANHKCVKPMKVLLTKIRSFKKRG